MSNLPTPRVTADMTLAEILVEIGLLLQEKFDRDGSQVSDADTNTRAGAAWPNAVDDWLQAAQANIDDLKETVADLESTDGILVKDTRFTGATTTASISAGADGNFTITMPTDRVSVQWLRVRANSGEYTPGADSRIQFFVDAARTKQCYDSDLLAGDPAMPTDNFVDGMAWGAFGDEGEGLEDSLLYGTVSNNGDSATTFTVRVVALAY